MMSFKLNLYIEYIGFVCIVMAFVGCDNILQSEPQSFETNENFYKSNDHFIQAVNGSYARLQDWILQAHVLTEGRSDNTTYDNQLTHGALALLGLGAIDRFTREGGTNLHEEAWNTIYTGIKDINVPLSRIENGIENGNLDQDLGLRLEGELKFLRAYFHFTAVRFWGEVPLITEPLGSGLEAFEIAQNSQEEVFEMIIQDLTDAETLLPESYSGSEVGRVTSGAAKSLLAKVYLTRAEYVEAEQKLREVIDSNQYSLLQNYADIFDPQNKNHAESIYEIQFREGSEGESSNFMYQFAPVNSFPEIIPVEVGNWGRNLPTNDMVHSYEEDDIRKEVSIGFYQRNVDDTNVAYVKKWHHTTDTNFARQNHNWPLIRYADVLLMLAEAINEQGYDPGEPFDLLNQVRNRAGLPSLSSSELPSQEAFRQALLGERRVELAFENHRWFDLIRFGVAVETLRAHGEAEINNPTTPINPVFPLTGSEYEVEPYMLLYPIPENELTINPNMEQNPGY